MMVMFVANAICTIHEWIFSFIRYYIYIQYPKIECANDERTSVLLLFRTWPVHCFIKHALHSSIRFILFARFFFSPPCYYCPCLSLSFSHFPVLVSHLHDMTLSHLQLYFVIGLSLAGNLKGLHS